MTPRKRAINTVRLWGLVTLLTFFAVLAACAPGDDEEDVTEDAEDVEEEDDAEADPDDDDEQDDEPDDVGEGQHGGTLRIAYPADPGTLDHMTATRQPNAPRRAVFEQLYGLDANLEPVPILATDHEVSDDRLTWEVGLQEGVQFHNGETMTADDVIASWERYEQVGVRAYNLDAVESVTALDDHRIEFELSEPHGQLLDAMAAEAGAWAIMPESIIDEIGRDADELDEEHFIGTGPYVYEDHEPEVQWTFTRFEDYWGGPEGEEHAEHSYMAGPRNAYFDTVEVRAIPDPSTRLAALEGGEVDVVLEVPTDQAERVDEDPDLGTQPLEPGWRLYWKMNPRLAPMDDDLVRDAIRTGFDPEPLLAAFGPEELWRVNCTPRFQEGQWPWSEQCDTYPQDMEQAQQLLEESSYDGEEITLLASPALAAEYPMVAPMEAYLSELGLNVTIDNVDDAAFVTIREDLDAWHIKQAGGAPIGTVDFLDASARDRTGEDWPNLSDDWYDLIAAAEREEDQEEREALVDEVYELHAEDNNEIWVGDVFIVAGYGSDIRNIPVEDPEMNFYDLWREE